MTALMTTWRSHAYFFHIKKNNIHILINLMNPRLKLHPPCITTNSDLIKGPDFGGEKNGEPFPLVFEVKILWTGPENIFPRSQLKVHSLPSQK